MIDADSLTVAIKTKSCNLVEVILAEAPLLAVTLTDKDFPHQQCLMLTRDAHVEKMLTTIFSAMLKCGRDLTAQAIVGELIRAPEGRSFEYYCLAQAYYGIKQILLAFSMCDHLVRSSQAELSARQAAARSVGLMLLKKKVIYDEKEKMWVQAVSSVCLESWSAQTMRWTTSLNYLRVSKDNESYMNACVEITQQVLTQAGSVSRQVAALDAAADEYYKDTDQLKIVGQKMAQQLTRYYAISCSQMPSSEMILPDLLVRDVKEQYPISSSFPEKLQEFKRKAGDFYHRLCREEPMTIGDCDATIKNLIDQLKYFLDQEATIQARIRVFSQNAAEKQVSTQARIVEMKDKLDNLNFVSSLVACFSGDTETEAPARKRHKKNP